MLPPPLGLPASNVTSSLPTTRPPGLFSGRLHSVSFGGGAFRLGRVAQGPVFFGLLLSQRHALIIPTEPHLSSRCSHSSFETASSIDGSHAHRPGHFPVSRFGLARGRRGCVLTQECTAHVLGSAVLTS